MRTKTLLLTAALTAAGIASSMAQVYSVNAVGYVNVTLKKGYNLISNPLNNAGNTIGELIPVNSNLPDGTVLVTWNANLGTIGGFDSDAPAFYPGIVWDPAGPALPPGQAFYLYIPEASPNATYTVTFVGEVPQGNLSVDMVGSGRYNSIATPVPQTGTISTDLKFTPSDGDTLLKWDSNKNPPGFADLVYVYNDGVGWNDGNQVVEPTIGISEGFFLLRTSTTGVDWTRSFSVNP
jgi:hypothetical protein